MYGYGSGLFDSGITRVGFFTGYPDFWFVINHGRFGFSEFPGALGLCLMLEFQQPFVIT